MLKMISGIDYKNYYFKSKIDRLELSEWNKMIWTDVKNNYEQMFENMKSILAEETINIEKKKKELQDIVNVRVCSKKKNALLYRIL
jgi:hypothetical protein